MANVLGQTTVNEIDILEIDQAPDTGSGAVAKEGSIASISTSGQISLWHKNGPLDTDWVRIYRVGDPISNVSGRMFNVTFFGEGFFGSGWWMRWNLLDYHESDGLPYRIPFDCQLIGYQFGQADDDADFGIEIYKNGTLSGNKVFDTGEINNVNQGLKTDITPVSFNRGDAISTYLRDYGSNVRDCQVEFYFVITSDNRTDQEWDLNYDEF